MNILRLVHNINLQTDFAKNEIIEKQFSLETACLPGVSQRNLCLWWNVYRVSHKEVCVFDEVFLNIQNEPSTFGNSIFNRTEERKDKLWYVKLKISEFDQEFYDLIY